MDPARIAAVRADVEKYGHEQDEIRDEATNLEHESKTDLNRHEWFAGIVTLLQVAIGLSAIGALIESRRVWIVSLIAGGVASAVFLVRVLLG